MSIPTPFLVALSGPTSSGKTTIATALKSIFPPTTPFSILHADDFYKADSQMPIHSTKVRDWDCAAALDLPKFRDTLRHIRAGGETPHKLIKQGGLEDGVHAHKSGLEEDFLERARQDVAKWLEGVRKQRKIVLVEGFLLFGEGVKDELAGLFDLRILLRSSREQSMQRRKSRNGYVTLEGFWQDPEGYFEDVVWPNFVKDYGFLFEGGDVEGRIKNGGELGVVVSPVVDAGLEETCKWVLGCLEEAM